MNRMSTYEKFVFFMSLELFEVLLGLIEITINDVLKQNFRFLMIY